MPSRSPGRVTSLRRWRRSVRQVVGLGLVGSLLGVIPPAAVDAAGPSGSGPGTELAPAPVVPDLDGRLAATPPEVSPSRRAPEELAPAPGEIVVVHAPGTAPAVVEAGAARASATMVQRDARAGIALLRVAPEDVEATVARLRSDPAVVAAGPNARRRILGAPSDPMYPQQATQMGLIRAPLAWDHTRGAATVKVGLVDTGIDLDHPDLAPNILSATSVVGGSGADVNGHGTAVAGIIAAVANNGIGISGVAPNVKILSYRVTGADGVATDYDLFSGIAQARYDGADVINVSIGGTAASLITDYLDAYWNEPADREPVIVAAAGDQGGPFPVAPAAYPRVLAVGAVDDLGHLSWTSNHGSWIDVVAPGVKVLSTKMAAGPTAAFERVSGTSFAAAHASGVAALAKTRLGPGATRASIVALLERTSRDRGAPGYDTSFGYGLVDAAAAAGVGIAPGSPVTNAGGDADSVPSGAVVFSTTVTGTISPETDADWFRFSVAGSTRMQVTVTPPPFSGARTAEMDPRVQLYDSQLRLILDTDYGSVGVPEVLAWNATPGTHYLRITNFAGSESPGTYSVDSSSLGPYVKETWAAATPLDALADEVVEILDANGDGRDDVVQSGRLAVGGPRTIWLRAQLPDHTLGAPSVLPIPADTLHDMDAGDLDGDGDTDLALGFSDGIWVSLQSAGTLSAPVQIATAPTYGVRVRVADLEGDGVPEVLRAGSLSDLTVLTRGPGGTYTAQGAGAPAGIGGMSTGDVDGDGMQEIVLPGGQSGTVAGPLILDRVAGTWTQRRVPTDPFDYLIDAVTGDFDGDGDTDVIGIPPRYSSTGDLIVFAQDDAGILAETARYATFRQEAILAADLDAGGGDEVVEVAAGTMRFHRQVAGGLSSWQDVAIPSGGTRYPENWDIGDIDGDGLPDVVINDDGVGSTAVRRAPAVATPVQAGRAWVEDSTPRARASGVSTTANLTVTSGADLAPASVTSDTVWLLHGRTPESLEATVTFDAVLDKITVNPVRSLAPGSGYALIVTGVETVAGDPVPLQIIPFRTASGSPPGISVTGSTYAPVSGDLDGNGESDVFWYNPSGTESVWWAWHDGFYSGGPYNGFGAGLRPVVGDFDGDTFGDFYAYTPGSYPGYGEEMFLGREFGDPYPYTTVNGTYTPLAGDFDADRMDDVFWYAPGTAADSIWYGGMHQAGFTRRASKTVNGTYQPVTGDFNGDYVDDILWYAPGTAPDYMWKGGRGGAFTSTPYTINGTYVPYRGDFDGNGVDDILWYTSAAGGDYTWSFRIGGSYTSKVAAVRAGVRPLVGDYDADQYDDVLWYGPGTAADTISWGSALGLVTR